QDSAHDLHLAFRGRAHTAGDIAVYCPQKKVLATGDCLHGFLPYLADAYPLEWPRTLHAWAEFDFEHVIPGHAAVQHTRDRLYHMSAYIEELTERVVRGKREGRSAAELAGSITPSSLATLERNGYGDFVAAGIAANRLLPPGTRAPDILSSGVKDNIAQIYARLDHS
ncbi:MAG: hypothetical protein ACRD96_28565, partial [Bryobacteraceae bacterium]